MHRDCRGVQNSLSALMWLNKDGISEFYINGSCLNIYEEHRMKTSTSSILIESDHCAFTISNNSHVVVEWFIHTQHLPPSISALLSFTVGGTAG